MRNLRWLWALVLAVAIAPGSLLAQQAATITGRVTGPGGEGIAAATVRIPAMNIGVTTGPDGTYRLPIPGARVQAGQQVQLSATRVGFGTQTRSVTLTPGATVTQNFQLAIEALGLEELVVTGVTGGATERAKVPFTVARVDAAQMPVQGVNPLSQLQGKVPGANIAGVSGRPGVAPQVILRGPTSINAAGRGQEPLYIVDGVVLGASIADINPADIESVEVVKGAAAATLFGSRAASGVISITTRRGNQEGLRFTTRSEVGFNDVERDFGIARFHPFLLDETGTRFCALDAYGSSNTCTRTLDYRAEQARINSAPGNFALPTVSFPVDPGAVTSGDILRRAFVAGRYPGTTFNAVEQLVDPKPLVLNDVSMSGRAGATNFFSSVGHTRQGGAIMGLNGYERINGRVNLGHRIGDQWSVDVSSYISRSEQDGSNQEEGGVGFFRLTRTPAIVDITQRDPLGRLYIRPNLGSAGTQNENPLYSFENIQRDDVRWRILGSGKTRYTPVEWFEADADFSVDRLNLNFQQFSNRGFRTTNLNPATNEGFIFNGVNNTQSINTSAGVTLRPEIASWVNPRFTGRWLYEQQDFDARSLSGQFLRVSDVTAAANSTQQQVIASSVANTRQMSFSGGAFLDVLDRYTFDFALRRDGSSRFGEENRWQTYGRASAAWLIARENWFPSEVVSALTVRGSVGTAGNVPSYAAQYETFSIGAGGALTAQTLGNPQLRPEVVTEVEVGADLELLNRYGLTVAYANSLARDQILPVPVAVSTGFPRQWQNAGELRNRTFEAALTLPVIQKRDFNWTTRANYTRNRAIVEKLNVPPFFMGTDLQATGEIMRVEEGVRFGTFFGRAFMRSCDQLPAGFRDQCGGPTSAFQVNNEGYVVWVGQGNNPGMGITHNLWNAVLPASQAPHGVQAAWGMPMLVRGNDPLVCAVDPRALATDPATGRPVTAACAPELVALGNALPDYRIGVSQTLQYKKLSLYGLVDGAFGRSVWNQGRHWSYLDFLSRDVDQANKSVEAAKPIGYYYRAGPGPGGNPNGLGGFYDILGPNNHFVEDASFIKLREVSAGYNFGNVALLRNVGDWSVSVIGRNLKTWTDYKGFDPEVGAASSGGQSGSGLINAIDAFTFPQLRSVSFVVSTSF
jgi:TonB-linked SusC/RagA family outer membrane protein